MIHELITSGGWDFLGLFLLLAGYIIGLGAVTVIDWHGFLARHSVYWTEATTRAHKVTKPLIWTGLFIALAGGLIFFREQPISGVPLWMALLAVGAVMNGLFLTFGVSTYLLKREKEGKSSELLPATWQRKIIVSFLFSVVCWWGSLLLLVWWLWQNLIV